jgi:GTP-binding protein HflX
MITHDEHDHETADTTTTSTEPTAGDDVVARVLARAENRSAGYALFRGTGAQALSAAPDVDRGTEGSDGDQSERADRQALRRVAGLSTELEDVTEVEYRQLRLENVVLIGVYSQGSVADAENSMRELAALAETAGAAVLDGLLQRRPTPDPSTYFGSGKAEELRALVAAVGADTVIADTELAPSQRRALEDVVKVKVIDRTAVILDIFSQHAKSREGKAQVELDLRLTGAFAAGATPCPARPVARWAARVRAWDPAAPVRRRSSSTAGASTRAWRSSASRSPG